MIKVFLEGICREISAKVIIITFDDFFQFFSRMCLIYFSFITLFIGGIREHTCDF